MCIQVINALYLSLTYMSIRRARCSASVSACVTYQQSSYLHGRAQLEHILRRTTTHHRHLAPQLAVRELLAEVHVTEVAHVRVEFERALRWRGRRMARSRRDPGAIPARSRRDLACISSAPYALTGLIAATTSPSSSSGDPHAGGGGRYERCFRAVFGLRAPLPVRAHSMSPLAMSELYLLGGGFKSARRDGTRSCRRLPYKEGAI